MTAPLREARGRGQAGVWSGGGAEPEAVPGRRGGAATWPKGRGRGGAPPGPGGARSSGVPPPPRGDRAAPGAHGSILSASSAAAQHHPAEQPPTPKRPPKHPPAGCRVTETVPPPPRCSQSPFVPFPTELPIQKGLSSPGGAATPGALPCAPHRMQTYKSPSLQQTVS